MRVIRKLECIVLKPGVAAEATFSTSYPAVLALPRKLQTETRVTTSDQCNVRPSGFPRHATTVKRPD
jgi:hypothetical protein